MVLPFLSISYSTAISVVTVLPFSSVTSSPFSSVTGTFSKPYSLAASSIPLSEVSAGSSFLHATNADEIRTARASKIAMLFFKSKHLFDMLIHYAL